MNFWAVLRKFVKSLASSENGIQNFHLGVILNLIIVIVFIQDIIDTINCINTDNEIIKSKC